MALAAALLAVGCATSYERLREQRTSTTGVGMAVVDRSHVLTASVDPSVNDVLAWWMFRYPAYAEVLTKYFAEGSIIVAAQDRPLVDPAYPQLGMSRALTRDNVCLIWWDTRDRGKDFDALLRHELGHVALNALRRGDVDHHVFMAAIGYPWQ